MQPIEFADILSTDLQLAHTGYLTARLLRDRSLTLTDIAYDFDFSSTAHLSRYIRQNLGISASEIRGGEK